MIHFENVTFKVSKKVGQKTTSKGNLYLECETNRGIIAIWGSGSNLLNINKVKEGTEPFELTSDRYVTPSWQKHKYWIPENANIQIK